MTSPQNKPGQSARKIRDDFHLTRILFALAGVLGLLICLLLIPAFSGAGIGAIFFLLIVMKTISTIVESKGKKCKKSERKAERGAKAEEIVDHILDQLTGDYAISHDVSTGHGDIDHILISREHGVFLLETKSHGGSVTVRNRKLLINNKDPEKDFIRQTIGNTMWLKEKIKQRTGIDIWIQPIIVFTNAFVKEWKPVRGILLRNKKYLLKAIKSSRTNATAMNELWDHHKQGKPIW